MYTLGKLLQAVGLVIPLVGMFRAFSEGNPDARGLAMTELSMLAGGAVLFIIGTFLVRKASS